jgi:selenophosphate synthase
MLIFYLFKRIFVFLYERIERSDVSERSGVTERIEKNGVIERGGVTERIEKNEVTDASSQNDEATTHVHCSHLQNWQPS